MIYPRLNVIAGSRSITSAFGGYDHRTVIPDGSFFDMKNLSSDKYPLLSNRKKRGIFRTEAKNITGIISKDTLCYTSGSDIVILNGDGTEEKERIDLGLDPDTEKQLVSMGAYVVIFPDKKYINTADIEDRGSLITSLSTPATTDLTIGSGVTYKLCTKTGIVYTKNNTIFGKFFPGDAGNEGIEDKNKFFCRVDDEAVYYYEYSSALGQWLTEPTYIRVETNTSDSFERGAIIGVSGIGTSITDDYKLEITDATITAGGVGYFVVKGYFCNAYKGFNIAGNYEIQYPTQSEPLTLTFSRKNNLSLCDLNGEIISKDKVEIGESAPSASDSASNGHYYIEKSGSVSKLYKKISGEWSEQTPYVKITLFGITDIDNTFEVGTPVNVSGFPEASDGTSTKYVNGINGENEISAVGSNWVVLKGLAYGFDEGYESLITTVEDESEIVIKRPVPDLDFVIESNNRLWGCKYGEVNGKKINEIYASKLGDFKGWCTLGKGISTDAYTASVGSDGPFTAAVAYLGHPTFFKEDRIYKIYGSYPSSYQLQETECRGVAPGSHKSLAVINEVLYYKSRSAVCVYDGSLPVEVSALLGDTVYSEAVGGALGNKYYVCMKVTSAVPDTHVIFAYDTARGLWHKEDSVTISDFAYHKGELYGVEHDNDRIITMNGSVGALDSDSVSWMAETGIIGLELPDKKYISKLDIRMSLETNHKAKFSIEYDSSGTWIPLFYMSGSPLGSFSVPVMPNRCDHFRLRIEGDGDVRIFSICKTVEQGGE